MGQVWGSSPAGQVVLGPLPGTWVVPISLGMGESRSGKVWVSIRGSSSLSLSLSLCLSISGCMSSRVCLAPLCVSAYLIISVPSLVIP